jgi:hypothetical protein
MELSGNHEADMSVLALRCPRDRTDVLRPPPPGLQQKLPEYGVVERDEAQLAVGKLSDLFRIDEVSALKSGHWRSLSPECVGLEGPGGTS